MIDTRLHHPKTFMLALFVMLALYAVLLSPSAVMADDHPQFSTPDHRRPSSTSMGLGRQDKVVPVQAGSSPFSAETHHVIVNNVPARDVLFALSRDSRHNIDIHPGIEGNVTLNAKKQTLLQILQRMAQQIDIRWEINDNHISVLPDTPYLRIYRVDYVNMSRETVGAVALSSQIGTTYDGVGASNVNSDNLSQTRVENRASNRFWDTLTNNLKEILHETDKLLPPGNEETLVEEQADNARPGNSAISGTSHDPAAKSVRNGKGKVATQQAADTAQQQIRSEKRTIRRVAFREAASVITHPESGILSVRATSRQHEKIREYLDHVANSVQRQVLVEATIAEIQLNHNFEQGVDWSRISLNGTGFSLMQTAVGNISAPPSSLIQIGYSNPTSSVGNISAAVKLLEAFGTVKVLSNPKISVLNNQTAILKIVDNQVYFTLNSETSQNQNTTVTTFTSSLHSVPVGFVMNVTAQIGENENVLLNIRPSISRIVGYVADPNPALKTANVVSEIPVVRSREMESMMSIRNGNIAIMGGLMEDSLNNRDNRVPVLSRIPLLGEFFTQRNDTLSKSELVVLLRPSIIRHAYSDEKAVGDRMSSLLPGNGFFNRSLVPGRSPLVAGEDQP